MTPSAEAPALSVDEAVPLLYAVVSRLAQDRGIRVLAIKGPALTEQGLRTPERRSVDVDILVNPARLDLLRASLESIDWHDEGFYDTPGIIPVHAVNHRNPLWPIELDVHHWFPGLLAERHDVFDVLWERREFVDLAHQVVPVPDRIAHLAISALNTLKDHGTTSGRNQFDELVALVSPSWTREQGDELVRLVADTGASETLRPLLERLGCAVPTVTRPTVVPLSDWKIRARMETTEVLPWIIGLKRTPWLRRPAYLWRAVWLDDDRFVWWDDSVKGSRVGIMTARWERARRGARALPRAWREYRRLTRGADDER